MRLWRRWLPSSSSCRSPPLFIGAGAIGLYLDRSEVVDAAFRPTEDIDVVVTLDPSTAEQSSAHALEAALRARGFVHDQRAHRRNMLAFVSPSGVPVDVIIDEHYDPADWPLRSRRTALTIQLGWGRSLRIPSPGFYLACKVAASRHRERWEGDYYSHDLEDIALLLSGCSAFPAVGLEAEPELQAYLSEWAREVLAEESSYGRDAFAVLMSNVPAAASLSDLRGLLLDLAGVPGGPAVP